VVKETAELRLLLDWQEQRWGADHPKVLASLESLADLLQMQGRYGEAEPLYWQILERKHEQFGANDLRVADTIYDLACLHERQENWDECERLYKWTCDIRCKLLPKGDAKLDDSVRKAQEAASRQGHDFDVATLQDVESPFYRTPVRFNWEGYLKRVEVLITQKRYEWADSILSCMVDVAEAYEPSSRMQAESLYRLGQVKFQQNNFSESLRLLEKALALFEKTAGTSSRETAACLEDMAEVYCKQNEGPEARFLFNWALQIHEALPGNQQHFNRLKDRLESLSESGRISQEVPAGEGLTPAQPVVLGQVDVPVQADLSELPVPAELPVPVEEIEPVPSPLLELAAVLPSDAESRLEQAAVAEEEAELLEQQPRDQVATFLWTKWIKTGKAALEKGDLARAETMLSRGLDKANEFGYQDSRLWQTLCDTAELYVLQSKFVKAESMLNMAQQYCEKTLGPMHEQNAFYWEKLGQLYEKQGDKAQAVRCFDRLVTILVKANHSLVECGVYLKKIERLREKTPASFFK
jgi:tetratricopeptide (TPR) repeat protein